MREQDDAIISQWESRMMQSSANERAGWWNHQPMREQHHERINQSENSIRNQIHNYTLFPMVWNHHKERGLITSKVQEELKDVHEVSHIYTIEYCTVVQSVTDYFMVGFNSTPYWNHPKLNSLTKPSQIQLPTTLKLFMLYGTLNLSGFIFSCESNSSIYCHS